jgi:hypothetical protein
MKQRALQSGYVRIEVDKFDENFENYRLRESLVGQNERN